MMSEGQYYDALSIAQGLLLTVVLLIVRVATRSGLHESVVCVR